MIFRIPGTQANLSHFSNGLLSESQVWLLKAAPGQTWVKSVLGASFCKAQRRPHAKPIVWVGSRWRVAKKPGPGQKKICRWGFRFTFDFPTRVLGEWSGKAAKFLTLRCCQSHLTDGFGRWPSLISTERAPGNGLPSELILLTISAPSRIFKKILLLLFLYLFPVSPLLFRMYRHTSTLLTTHSLFWSPNNSHDHSYMHPPPPSPHSNRIVVRSSTHLTPWSPVEELTMP